MPPISLTSEARTLVTYARADSPTSSRFIIILIFAIITLLSLPLPAQQGLPQGSISGTVADASGAAISRAQVKVSAEDSSVVRTSDTKPDGTFRSSGLASGNYQISITSPGFTPYRSNWVVVAVGRDSQLSVTMVPLGTTQQVTVTSQSAALDTTETSPVTNVDKDRIEELPIPSRNYLSFTLLAPSLGSANPAIGASAHIAAGEGGFSTSGLRPSSNAVYIDGVEDNDEFTGMSRTQLSPEAISDFQIINHGYAAQSGGSAGGAVDVETRKGLNVVHGDAFLFIQNGALNAIPALELVPHRPDEKRLRAGFSLGGALKPKRFFYYIASEQEMARGEEAGDFSPQESTKIDAALAGSGPLRGMHVRQGFFPTTNGETEFSGRLDGNFSTNSLMLRYALTNNRSVNDAFNGNELADASARGSAFYNDNSLIGAWTRTFSPQLANQFTVAISQRRVALRTASSNGPGVEVAGVLHIGTPYSGNSRRYETHVDTSEGVLEQHGRHLLQAGAALSHIGLRSAVLDGFGGTYVFSDLNALALGQPDFYIQSFGNPDSNFAETRISAYLQNHWKVAKSLTLDYGLRYEFNRLSSTLPEHPLNLSPRLGLAWSPGSNWVIRGGFGIFMDRYVLGTVNRIEEFDGIHALQQVAEGAQAALLYQNGAIYSAPHAGIPPSIWTAQSSLANPYSETTSISVERALPAQWIVKAECRFVHGVKMGRTVNVNLPQPVSLTPANAAGLGIPNPTPQQLGRAVFPQLRLNPAYDSINQFQTEASSSYNGFTLTLNRQFTEDLELMAGYTFSKTIDDASQDGAQPQNPYALQNERSLSLNDQRHRFVLSGLWVLGPDLDDPRNGGAASSPNAFLKAMYGLEFAPIVGLDSGFRNNPLTGMDSNREHIFPFADRPTGLTRNALRTRPDVNIDLRILKMIPIWRGHLDIVCESFNLLNRQNVEMDNAVFGEGADPIDSFNKPVQIADSRQVQFSLDYEF